MTPLVWLVVAVVAGAAAWLVGWPAWRGYRDREARDLNAERYLAWRGRAASPGSASMREGLTLDERRRLYLAGGLALVALVSLLVFFLAT